MKSLILGFSVLLSISAFASETRTQEVEKEKVSKQASAKDCDKKNEAGIKEYRNEFFGK
ncbi:hypothetical protein M902_0811 [Bacteriovorax sp. BAL6_X]|uniref:hypothetical protein n=1 Tax=Bacteriovorax sp. BAL6_X TaxID=1201290 RepID=UPI0003859397|nr:hypothetical protein [Bacteriovorax sp. BAL6_X]EPZ49767.1 hypothetical protein M902_0811 [Bacteriovorax sp. BAL6_X]